MCQVQVFMCEYGVEEGEVLVVQVFEVDVCMLVLKWFVVWESYFVNMVGFVFGMQVFFGFGLKFWKGCKIGCMFGVWKFVGMSVRFEVVCYMFEVLLCCVCNV